MPGDQADGLSREDVRPDQIQYQLLTAQLAIGQAYDGPEEAPEGVNEALDHITTAMNLLGDDEISVSEAEPDSRDFQDLERVYSEMETEDWQDVEASEFIDIAKSPIKGRLAFVFEHPGLGLHGFEWRPNIATLRPVTFQRQRGDDDAE